MMENSGARRLTKAPTAMIPQYVFTTNFKYSGGTNLMATNNATSIPLPTTGNFNASYEE